MSGNDEKKVKIRPEQRTNMKVCQTCVHRYAAYPYTGAEDRCRKYEEGKVGNADYIVVKRFQGCDYWKGMFY